jgi:hypothetical protein
MYRIHADIHAQIHRCGEAGVDEPKYRVLAIFFSSTSHLRTLEKSQAQTEGTNKRVDKRTESLDRATGMEPRGPQ